MNGTISNNSDERGLLPYPVILFQKDVQLLTDLQELISDAERTANMPGYAGAVFNAISPALKAAMPAAQKKARRQIDVLTRAKERLMELMEEPQK